jgi:pimeloyl-ACP methyl ester carboxylesterase
MPQLAHARTGAGAPLVLLHPLGMTRRVWDPVVPALAEHFDVIAVDLPGFGDSAPLPAQVEPSPATLAAAVAGLLGSRDVLLLPHQSRHVDQLPAGTRVGQLPACGHVPVADNPGAVTALIRESVDVSGTESARRSRSAAGPPPRSAAPAR